MAKGVEIKSGGRWLWKVSDHMAPERMAIRILLQGLTWNAVTCILSHPKMDAMRCLRRSIASRAGLLMHKPRHQIR